MFAANIPDGYEPFYWVFVPFTGHWWCVFRHWSRVGEPLWAYRGPRGWSQR